MRRKCIYSRTLKIMQQKCIFQIVARNGGDGRRERGGLVRRGADMGNDGKRCD